MRSFRTRKSCTIQSPSEKGKSWVASNTNASFMHGSQVFLLLHPRFDRTHPICSKLGASTEFAVCTYIQDFRSRFETKRFAIRLYVRFLNYAFTQDKLAMLRINIETIYR